MITLVPGDRIDLGTVTMDVTEVYLLTTSPGWAEITGRAGANQMETTRRIHLDSVRVVEAAR